MYKVNKKVKKTLKWLQELVNRMLEVPEPNIPTNNGLYKTDVKDIIINKATEAGKDIVLIHTLMNYVDYRTDKEFLAMLSNIIAVYMYSNKLLVNKTTLATLKPLLDMAIEETNESDVFVPYDVSMLNSYIEHYDITADELRWLALESTEIKVNHSDNYYEDKIQLSIDMDTRVLYSNNKKVHAGSYESIKFIIVNNDTVVNISDRVDTVVYMLTDDYIHLTNKIVTTSKKENPERNINVIQCTNDFIIHFMNLISLKKVNGNFTSGIISTNIRVNDSGIKFEVSKNISPEISLSLIDLHTLPYLTYTYIHYQHSSISTHIESLISLREEMMNGGVNLHKLSCINANSVGVNVSRGLYENDRRLNYTYNPNSKSASLNTLQSIYDGAWKLLNII